MSQPKALDATLYRDVFQDGTIGGEVLEELIMRFGRDTYVAGGAEGARQTDFNCGKKAVIDFIILRINQANGVDKHVQTEVSITE